MDVGAPFMTPGAGTARPVRGVVRGSVRDVSGQLRRCVGCSGGDGRRGAIYDARCRNGTTRPRRCSRRCTRCFRPIAALRRLSGRHKCRPYVLGCSSAILRRTDRSDAWFGCAVASVVRAVMDVGAPFMTPGAGTAQPVRGIARCGVRDVSGQLRCCDGLSGDTSVAPTLRDARPRRCDGLSGDTSVAPTFGGGILRHSVGCSRGDGRRGAIYDARCRNGTPRPRHCARRCTRRFRPIAALRRLSGRHKCRPYVGRRVWRPRCLPTR